jgi:winged helix DNA-binding protein
VLSRRDLNRTLLRRQHLLERTTSTAVDMVAHLVGLQAQDTLPPYLSLAARIDAFDPRELSAALEGAELVRLLSLRGTIHVLTPADALTLRSWVQPAIDRAAAGNQTNRPARDIPVADVVAATRRLLSAGPLPVKDLGDRLAESFPGAPGAALGQVARERVPLVQLPPRGLWRRSGGVVYQTVENHLGRPTAEVDLRGLVRRYLAAFGPATAADMTTWSRVTRLGPVFGSMREELQVVECEDGRQRYDVPGAPYASGDEPAPPRLLGGYDNLWLSHADRRHVLDDVARRRWAGVNGGTGNAVFVDGFMAGLWWWREGDVHLETFRPLTRAERADLDQEVDRVCGLLSR